ncbi:Alpha-ketoglutarate-dependent sulfonate dioxygenase, putative [Candida maltosa Xu316]|uniref:Alpha-ketoglutarate-dependent sulfonate dioxygenase, putative n=1 Tax=Candida maltosa (strain Xu316) TaxID=1245528 RepID=M3J7T6_CANMX|nr:Alpha-ketoglutarate-dependent sulfonate dioxygenase, putative [Candida maltosa Xu316]
MSPVADADKYDASQFQSSHVGKTTSGSFTVSDYNKSLALYPEYLPTWNPNQKFPSYTFQEYHDRGLLADPQLSNLFPPGGDYNIRRISPKLGSEITGIQLSQLDSAAKNDLAKFVAERGVVVFKNQDFNNGGPQKAVEFCKYFGSLYKHPTSGSPEGFPELHVCFLGADQDALDNVFKDRTNSVSWHSDCSYALNGLQLTLFSCLQLADSGGDTLFANSVEAYERLSPAMKERLEGLHVLHSSLEQANNNKQAGGITRRAPEANIHPLVRINPVTEKKHLYLNKEFGRRIVELKEDESDYLLSFLFDHIEKSSDLQIRVRWEENTVVLWNNSTTIHSPCVDFDEPIIRHAYRISVMGERPVGDLKYLNDVNYLQEKYTELGI